MALSNYTELKSSIASWFHRSDLTSVIPDFITLGESRIVRDLMQNGGHRKLGKSATITPTANVAAFPTDYQSLRSISSTYAPYPISLVTVEILRSSYAISGTGKAYAVDSTGILLSPDAGQSNIKMDYWITPTVMTDSTTTNELFPLLSDLYFFAAMVEGSQFIQSDPSQWEMRYQNALLTAYDKASRYGSAMRVVAA